MGRFADRMFGSDHDQLVLPTMFPVLDIERSPRAQAIDLLGQHAPFNEKTMGPAVL